MGTVLAFSFLVFTIGVFIFIIVFPISLKRSIIRKAERCAVLDEMENVFRISPIGYFIGFMAGLYLLIIFTLIPCYLFFRYSSRTIGESIFISLIAILGLLCFLIYFRKVFFLYPKTFISFNNGLVTYYNGKKEIKFYTKDIIDVEFQEYHKSFFWYLLIIVKKNEEGVALQILAFNKPSKIYALMTKKKRKRKW